MPTGQMQLHCSTYFSIKANFHLASEDYSFSSQFNDVFKNTIKNEGLRM
jgi:hypothetical protein